MESTQTLLKSQVDELYASLNIVGEYPELTKIGLPFLRKLLLARDMKINIRKNAVGSFFEWERLDRAVGGHHLPLGELLISLHTCLIKHFKGTKLHQVTRKAIAKRKPALLRAISKFNSYCDELRDLAPLDCPIPIPQHLPTELNVLRDIENSGLMEDVWITPCDEGNRPRWLVDVSVRNGIRAMLKADRCLEERQRLGREANNLCRWFGQKLTAVETALRLPQCEFLLIS